LVPEVNPRQIQLPLAHEQSTHISKNELLRNIPSIAPLESGILPTQQPTLEDEFIPATEFLGAEDSPVSTTGSFAPLGATGAFAPVSEELLKQHSGNESIYIDDADDATLGGEAGEDGGYVHAPHMTGMPTSRARSFFGSLGDKFSGRKRRENLDDSPTSWLGVDEDYDARKAGGEIGSWRNFSEESDASWQDAETWQDDDDAWKGGAYGGASYDSDFKAIQALGGKLIDKEVWLVATGSQEAEGAGIKAFMASHASALRGATIINLDSVGAGELCYTIAEGTFRLRKTDQRLQNLVRAAADIANARVDGVTFAGYQSDAAWALAQGARAISLIGLDHDYPVAWRSKDDTLEILDEDAMARVSNLVFEVIKSV
jgi:hypothetical protein